MGGENKIMGNHKYINPTIKKILDSNIQNLGAINALSKNHPKNLSDVVAHTKYISNQSSPIINSYLKSTHFSNTDEFMKFRNGVLNAKRIVDSTHFQRNLFSKKALDSFIEISNFSKKDILEMSYAIRNLNVNPTIESTFTESIDSSHPVNSPKEEGDADKFQRVVKSHIVAPSNKLVNVSSKTIFVETISEFVLKNMHGVPINTNVYIWVLFFSYLGFCLTYKYE